MSLEPRAPPLPPAHSALKTERPELGLYRPLDEARSDVFEYIEPLQQSAASAFDARTSDALVVDAHLRRPDDDSGGQWTQSRGIAAGL